MNTPSPSQSAPTILKCQVDLIFFRLWNFKKKVQKNRLQKAGCKKQGHCYSKREETAWPFLFLNNIDPVFCTLLFAPHILDPVFFRVSYRPMFSKQEWWVQIDWASGFAWPQLILAPMWLARGRQTVSAPRAKENLHAKFAGFKTLASLPWRRCLIYWTLALKCQMTSRLASAPFISLMELRLF